MVVPGYMEGELGTVSALQQILDLLNAISGDWAYNLYGNNVGDLGSMGTMSTTSLSSMGTQGGGGGATFDFRGATFYNLADFEDAVAAAVVTAYRRGGLRFSVSPTGARGSSSQSVGVSGLGGV